MQPNPFPEDNFPSKYLYQPKKDESIGYDILSYPAKSKEILAKVISERISFLRKSIEEISGQIQERQRLKETLNSDIDETLCQTKAALYELSSLGTIADNLNSSRKSSLETLLATLHKEKRHQKLLHWQDTVMLERELRDMEKEMLSAQRDLWMVRFVS